MRPISLVLRPSTATEAACCVTDCAALPDARRLRNPTRGGVLRIAFRNVIPSTPFDPIHNGTLTSALSLSVPLSLPPSLIMKSRIFESHSWLGRSSLRKQQDIAVSPRKLHSYLISIGILQRRPPNG